MAKIRTFRAIRPAKDYTDRVAALPYDVYDRAEARVAAHKDPLSFLNIDRPETQFEEGHDMYADDVYAKAASMIRDEIAEGVLVQDEQACFYIYELTMDGRIQTGIVGCASIDDYQKGIVRRHENTRADKELDRIRHVDTCCMQTGPIFLAYRADQTISAIVAKTKESDPEFSFTSEDGIRHRGWIIADLQDQKLIENAFDQSGTVYIADGHHRAASAVKAGMIRRERHPEYSGEEEFNSFLSVLFPDEELMIMDYNRVVHDLNGYTEEQLLEKISKTCVLRAASEAVKPSVKGSFGICLKGKWYEASFKEECKSSDPVEGLDVSLLQNLILKPLLGIDDPKTDKRIEFVGGIRGLGELERKSVSFGGVSFSMFPTSIHELFDVADANRLMPPKSTWFEPKLRSGLFLHEIGD